MLRDSNELNDFQACMQRIQLMNTSSCERIEFWNKEFHQCFEILRKKDDNNVWKIWTSFEGIEDMPDILANNAIKELERDFSVNF